MITVSEENKDIPLEKFELLFLTLRISLIDLADTSNISDDNNGITYLLFVIDIFSKYLWVKPLKNKTAKDVVKALKIY